MVAQNSLRTSTGYQAFYEDIFYICGCLDLTQCPNGLNYQFYSTRAHLFFSYHKLPQMNCPVLRCVTATSCRACRPRSARPRPRRWLASTNGAW